MEFGDGEPYAAHPLSGDMDSAPLNPRWGPGTAAWFYFGAPDSPVHNVVLSSAPASPAQALPRCESFTFQVSASYSSDGSSADELFQNGQITPMRLPSLADVGPNGSTRDDQQMQRRSSLHQRSLSMLPPKLNSYGKEAAPLSRSSSFGRNSWIFLKELLHRSNSEGTGAGSVKGKLLPSISFKDLVQKPTQQSRRPEPPPQRQRAGAAAGGESGHGVGKRRSTAQSLHERHYAANRAAADGMRKRTSLPYREGLFACLG